MPATAVERLERVAWPMAALAWLYLIFHAAHRVGFDFSDVYLGPHNLLHGLAFYPPTKHATADYLFPPSSPVLLAPLGVLSRSLAGPIFVVVSAGAFTYGLYRLASRTAIPALIVLGAGVSYPVRSEIALGNADLLCAGLIAISLSMRGRARALPLGLALAIKPTVWPILAVFGLDALVAAGLAMACVLIGLMTIVDVGRFFSNVIPYLSSGEPGTTSIRTSLPDAAVAVGLPHGPISALCLIALLVALAFIVYRGRGRDITAHAPLVIILALLLSSYSFALYIVYFIAVLPLLRPKASQLALLGVALYLIGSTDIWSSSALSHMLNTLLNFKELAGLAILVPIAAAGHRPARVERTVKAELR